MVCGWEGWVKTLYNHEIGPPEFLGCPPSCPRPIRSEVQVAASLLLASQQPSNGRTALDYLLTFGAGDNQGEGFTALLLLIVQEAYRDGLGLVARGKGQCASCLGVVLILPPKLKPRWDVHLSGDDD